MLLKMILNNHIKLMILEKKQNS